MAEHIIPCALRLDLSILLDRMLLLIFCGLLAGLFGSIAGVGGGLITVPFLTLILGYDIKTAVAASLIGVIASSSTTGMLKASQRFTNFRLATTLEIPTTIGAICGGYLSLKSNSQTVSLLFAFVLMGVALTMWFKKESVTSAPTLKATEIMADSYFDPYLGKVVHYSVQRIGFGCVVSYIAGILSGLLGVGGGFMKVPAMTLGMNVPIRVAASTSNFMVGVTALSSFTVYYLAGFLNPEVAAPLILGVIAGALLGIRASTSISADLVRKVFVVLAICSALQMALKNMGGLLGS